MTRYKCYNINTAPGQSRTALYWNWTQCRKMKNVRQFIFTVVIYFFMDQNTKHFWEFNKTLLSIAQIVQKNLLVTHWHCATLDVLEVNEKSFKKINEQYLNLKYPALDSYKNMINSVPQFVVHTFCWCTGPYQLFVLYQHLLLDIGE